MTVVAVSANRRTRIAARDGFRVNALPIGKEWAVADAASLHHRLITVTSTARLGNVRSIDGRLSIARRQNRRHVAILCVAIKTRGSLGAIVNRFGMKAVIVGGMRLGVKERAG